MKKTKIVITHKAVYADGVVRFAGDIVEVADDIARELIGVKRAVKYVPPIPQKPHEAEPKEQKEPKAPKKGGTTE